MPSKELNTKPPYPSEDATLKICSYILDGLSLRDACLLAGYPYNVFQAAVKEYPQVANLVDKKRAEFKHARLKRIKDDPKTANQIWILENLLPDEFGKKAQSQSQENPVATIANFIKEIQKNNDQTQIVSHETNMAQAKKNSDGSYSVDDVLN